MNYGRMKMNEICTDNRFELIQKYKEKLIQGTNIETSKEEMNVIDDILFRFWQMGWLEALEKQIPKEVVIQKINEDIELLYCPNCHVRFIRTGMNCCGNCGQALDWSDNK